MNRTLKTLFFVIPKVFTGGETKVIFLKSTFTKDETKGTMPYVFQCFGEERLKAGFGRIVAVLHETKMTGIYKDRI